MNRHFKIATVLLLIAAGCKDFQNNDKNTSQIEKSVYELNAENTQSIVNKAIIAHGGTLYDSAHYQFVFRDKLYSFENQKGYTYKVSSKDSLGNQIEDILKDGKLARTVNNELVELSKKDIAKYSEALNSVIYFATLPHKLNDKAVQKEGVGETIIKGEDYDVVKVTFGKVGGGKDFDDVFMYWINKKSHYINYLAYSYSVNDGGVRFRSAYNPRTIDGIRFQDYINWEAPVGTPLTELPAMFEKGKLKELSRIETTDIQNLNSVEVVE
ncbi:hypothetical protein SAMN04488008_104396 [Maribacter orientalis]|uniref:Deoxyribose-phosphate aldolase n=1 Tax=Maribacter orientalis TaxID=228957 RepID=A0A1H7RUN3_9FLAO|nr:DUF6503 family protein [Maribacter orientalis]SEL63719.1 hypothetical protein SAMN04488008_104396 [Maribacter orientalis]